QSERCEIEGEERRGRRQRLDPYAEPQDRRVQAGHAAQDRPDVDALRLGPARATDRQQVEVHDVDPRAPCDVGNELIAIASQPTSAYQEDQAREWPLARQRWYAKQPAHDHGVADGELDARPDRQIAPLHVTEMLELRYWLRDGHTLDALGGRSRDPAEPGR